MRKILIVTVLNILIIVFVLFYCCGFNNIFKSNSQEFVTVQKADTLVFGDVIIRKFNNLKLFKTEYFGKYHYLQNKDISEIRKYLNDRGYKESEESSYIIQDYLNRGLDYYSSFADKNYNKLPDTIWATGYEVRLYRLIDKFDPTGARRIKIMSCKYKK